jgi:hypothetical protein
MPYRTFGQDGDLIISFVFNAESRLKTIALIRNPAKPKRKGTHNAVFSSTCPSYSSCIGFPIRLYSRTPNRPVEKIKAPEIT